VHAEESIGREVKTAEDEQLEGNPEDFGLEVYAMNCVQRTGRRSFCDSTDAEDTESTFSKRLPPDLPDLCGFSFEKSTPTMTL
jgi:hypothetical protein